jgi:predicted alpha/beta-fold hydrolase
MSTPAYQAPWWLPGPHLQTIYPTLALRPVPPPYRRETWETPDGDFLDVDWVDGPDDAPLMVLFHGLEGGSRSPYAAALMHAVRARGWRGAVPHFRGCGGRPNRLARAYHSGDADEIGWMLRQTQAASAGRLYAAGVSLGGNALLKWLAREPRPDDARLSAAAAVCPPLDLVAAGAALRRGFNRLYTWQFLRTLKPKTLAKCRAHPGLFDPQRIASARDFDTFDDAYTAPAHGFAGVQDYWRRASSKPVLDRIRIPTLVISARNDPFLPAQHLPGHDAVSSFVTLEQPAMGGHVGFVSGPFPGHLRWLPERLLGFFAEAAPPGDDVPSTG